MGGRGSVTVDHTQRMRESDEGVCEAEFQSTGVLLLSDSPLCDPIVLAFSIK